MSVNSSVSKAAEVDDALHGCQIQTTVSAPPHSTHLTLYIFPTVANTSMSGAMARATRYFLKTPAPFLKNSAAFIAVVVASTAQIGAVEFALTTASRNFISGTTPESNLLGGRVCRDRCGYGCAAFGA